MRSLTRFSALAAAAALAGSAFAQTIHLKPILKGGMQLLGGYMPRQATLSSTKPDNVSKIPGDLSSPLYGVLSLNGKDFTVLVDSPDGKPSRVFVDVAGNGDLTQQVDAWTPRPYQDQQGGKHTMYMGSGKVAIGLGGSADPAAIGLYRFDPKDPGRAQFASTLFYYPDYAFDGEANLGGKSYHVLIGSMDGDYTGKAAPTTGPAAAAGGLKFMIDVNHNGKFDARGERYDATKPFNVAGTTYELSNLKDLSALAVKKSAQTVAEILPPPDLSSGHKILAFDATTVDGKKVSFPNDYRGKVVLLDFWATWCGPCMGEVPSVVSVYNKLHGQGFEILGVSLDTPETIKNLGPVTKDKGMTWQQIADGKGWQAAIASQFVVQSIPQAYLVDGDTGMIIAEGNAIRGEALEPAITKALAAKGKGKSKK